METVLYSEPGEDKNVYVYYQTKKIGFISEGIVVVTYGEKTREFFSLVAALKNYLKKTVTKGDYHLLSFTYQKYSTTYLEIKKYLPGDNLITEIWNEVIGQSFFNAIKFKDKDLKEMIIPTPFTINGIKVYRIRRNDDNYDFLIRDWDYENTVSGIAQIGVCFGLWSSRRNKWISFDEMEETI